ncbi:MAG: hypothetical protein LBR54_01430 [Oscillospiraceae bacterium]|jgi:hypothetical protein|nr:hypothetical protein [Oscillospiraceae bacterium]
MQINLVLEKSGDTVHGTDNFKKTACGINLLKPEIAAKYVKSDVMKDLKEITCPKCKEILAMKMIKESRRAMESVPKVSVSKAEISKVKKEERESKSALSIFQAPVGGKKKIESQPPVGTPPKGSVSGANVGELPPLKINRYDPRLQQKKNISHSYEDE